MIHLHEIANDDFILFHADQPVAQASEAVRRLEPTSVVVRRWEEDTVYYYLYTAQQFFDELAQADDEVPLLYALRLHEWAATPALDAYQDAEGAPPRGVIIDGDRVVGFYDVTPPPLLVLDSSSPEHRRRELLGRVDSLEGLPAAPVSTPVSRSLQAEFPEEVAQGQTASLLVWLTQQMSQQHGLPIAVSLGTELDIVVQVQQGFVLEGRGEGNLIVTDKAKTLPIQFKLCATEIGPGRISVFCFQGGYPLGEITLAPTVVAADQAAEGERTAGSQSLAPFAVTQPDLTLRIFEQETQGQLAITLELLALDPALGLNWKPFGPIKLRMNPLEYFQYFFQDIEGLRIETADDQAIAVRRLALKGARLFQDLLPEDLRVLLWSLRDRIRSVQVLSDEPWIPWELLKLQGQENGRVVEGPFLCEAFAMTRWFPGIGRRPELRLKRMALVIPSDSGLDHAPEERDYLLSLADGQRQVTEVPATYLEVIDSLSRGEHDGWHFSGHGHFSAPDPNRSHIELERGQSLCAEDINGMVRNCGLARPLVFLNACQTGREALSLTGVGGWARRFVEAGAAGFVGSLWSVYDQAAYKFAKVFYDHLLAGETIGQAAKEARAAIRPLKDLTWLAYTVFADPLATVQ